MFFLASSLLASTASLADGPPAGGDADAWCEANQNAWSHGVRHARTKRFVRNLSATRIQNKMSSKVCCNHLNHNQRRLV